MTNIKDKYRLTFLRDEVGIEVLADILRMCHFGCTLDMDNAHQVAEYNVGVALLHRLGIYGEDTLFDIVNALSGVEAKESEPEPNVWDKTI